MEGFQFQRYLRLYLGSAGHPRIEFSRLGFMGEYNLTWWNYGRARRFMQEDGLCTY